MADALNELLGHTKGNPFDVARADFAISGRPVVRYNEGKGGSTMTIRAIYENGVFRPTEKVSLPDRCEVEVDIRQVKEPAGIPTLDHDLPTWEGQVLSRLTREEIYDERV